MKKITGDVKHLYNLGFDLHLLHKNSKRPIHMKWAARAKEPWGAIVQGFKPGMNIGVRLGRALKSGKFLAAIDCDVKSDSPKHLAEMEEKLASFIGAGFHTPTVLSGRGNGSKHIYFVTKTPVNPRRLAQSSDKVKVSMPSEERSPSKYELGNLTSEEIKEGVRIRPAWEISLMGIGQQVVIPPSIHPDSKRSYKWKEPGRPNLRDLRAIPKLDLEKDGMDGDARPLSTKVSNDWKPVPIDLELSTLDDETLAKIKTGAGVEDRSAALLGVANKMLLAGFKDDEILTVLTDPDTFLGETAYSHAQTTSRRKAANWIKKYTLEKSKRETDAARDFEDEVVVTEISEEKQASVQAKADKDAEKAYHWTDDLTCSDDGMGPPKNTLKNVILILTNVAAPDVFKRNEFANTEIYGCKAPWLSNPGDEIRDLDVVRIKEWLTNNYSFEPSNDRVIEAIAAIADRNRFHPVRDYLDKLEWDGKPRLDTWLKRYMNAKAEEPYLSAISRKILVAMVKRVYQPGAKFDQVLILQGDQGRGKSRALNALASDEWFSDAHINVADKDAVMTMQSMWLIEMGELSGMRKADAELLKEFISRRTDRIRVPYGKKTENFPRQCVFIGTTNQKEYLKDATGNRRYWPVTVGSCKVDLLRRDRNQLFAEAKVAYGLDEPLYLEDDEMVKGAEVEQGSRMEKDEWEELIQNWIEGTSINGDEMIVSTVDKAKFRLVDLFDSSGPLGAWKLNPPEQKRASIVLGKLGFENRSVYLPELKRTGRFWMSKSDLTPENRH